MDVIIFADRKEQELLPLTDQTCVPLLPLAGKLIIEHTLEALVDAGLRRAHIILSPFAEQVKEAVGNGKRWGMDLSYSTSRGEGDILAELGRLQNPPLPPCLIVRGDVVRSAAIKEFLQQAEAVTAPCVQALYNGENAYLLLCRDLQNADVDCLNWTAADRQVFAATTLELNGRTARLDSLPAFHQANLDAAAGRLPGLLIPGRQIALGLTQGRNTEAYPQNLKHGIALIGSNCHLHPSVELNGEVVIGDNVIIDSRVTITSSVILPHSYIGELVELRNAIVRGNDLIRVDNLAVLKISDTFLMADLKTTNVFNSGLDTLLNRIAGAVLLLLSLPLWLPAIALAVLQTPAQPYRTTRLRGNKIELNEFGMPQRTEFAAGEFQTSVPVLRYLPRILAIFSGDIAFFGALPVSLDVASRRQEDWEKLADQLPAGLLGPTQLNLGADASEEEIVMSDSFYAANISFKANARFCLQAVRALFTRKAWCG